VFDQIPSVLQTGGVAAAVSCTILGLFKLIDSRHKVGVETSEKKEQRAWDALWKELDGVRQELEEALQENKELRNKLVESDQKLSRALARVEILTDRLKRYEPAIAEAVGTSNV
jgi:uncharacterized coiled-coil protein SlyX